MKCEYCDSIISNAPDNGACPNCGTPLETNIGLSSAPFFTKETRWGSFAFEKHAVRLSVKLPKVPRNDVAIAYGDVYDASYVAATKWHVGFLCVRDIKKRSISLPQNIGENIVRDDIIWFEICDNDVFYQAYVFLKKCAKTNMDELQKRLEQAVYPKPPFQTKNGVWDNLTFEKDAIKLSLKHPDLPKRDVVVPYRAIYDTSFVAATDFHKGFLCVRDIANCGIPMPKSFRKGRMGDNIIWFKSCDNDEFYLAYVFLKKCAVINAKIIDNQ